MSVSLDHIADLVKAYRSTQAEADRWQQAADVLRRRIQEEIGDAEEATIAGAPAFTWRHTGQFAARRFTTEQPDLAAKYTRPVTRDELDTDALAAEHPDVYTAYRARRFERKG